MSQKIKKNMCKWKPTQVLVCLLCIRWKNLGNGRDNVTLSFLNEVHYSAEATKSSVLFQRYAISVERAQCTQNGYNVSQPCFANETIAVSMVFLFMFVNVKCFLCIQHCVGNTWNINVAKPRHFGRHSNWIACRTELKCWNFLVFICGYTNCVLTTNTMTDRSSQHPCRQFVAQIRSIHSNAYIWRLFYCCLIYVLLAQQSFRMFLQRCHWRHWFPLVPPSNGQIIHHFMEMYSIDEHLLSVLWKKNFLIKSIENNGSWSIWYGRLRQLSNQFRSEH